MFVLTVAGVVAGVTKGVLPVVVPAVIAGDCIIDWSEEDDTGVVYAARSASDQQYTRWDTAKWRAKCVCVRRQKDTARLPSKGEEVTWVYR